MTPLQRLGLVAILWVIVVLLASITRVLTYQSGVSVPLASWVIMGALLAFGTLAWIIESKGKNG